MALKQANRLLSLFTPLGDDQLVLTSWQGHEEISRLFQFQLEMISDNNNIQASDIVGKNVSFSIKLADETPRFLNGHVNRFFAGDERDGRRNYRAEVVPWLWFLTRTADCRIFQNMTAPSIIEQIFIDLGFTDFKMSMSGAHPQREYCVQYRETDFNFVSRLMEEEGMFYFFKHDKGKHELVIADKPTGYVDCVEKEVDYPTDVGSRAMADHITNWEHRYEFRTGKWAQTDYDFKNPSGDLMNISKTVVPLPGSDKYEFYDYPGIYTDKSAGKSLTDVHMEEEEVEHDIVVGTSGCKSFTPGGKFKVVQHKSSSEEGKSFVITSVQHRVSEPQGYETGGGGAIDYANSFTCIPSKVTFRPARVTPKPFVQGVQTAVVTGPGGEEIYVDEFGRVKVQFHWDREGKKDENTSCWMRVSQVHAGKSFGGIDIPRMGEEVIISFLEGDPDRPLITGRVYHAENMPPFGLPGSKTISGLKSKTYKGEGYNEYVMDDTPGNELIREHGQFDKDSTIEHDLREHVLNDRSRDVTNNETIAIGVDRTETVGNNESLTVGANRTESVGANETLSVGSNRTRSVGGSETVTVALTRTHTVGINEAITVGAAQEITIGAVQAVTIGASQMTNVGGSQSISVGGDQANEVGSSLYEGVAKNRSATVGGNDSLDVGKKLTITAGDEITIKTGKASIVMKKDGTVNIEGKDITIKGSGKITGKAAKDMVLKGKKILEN